MSETRMVVDLTPSRESWPNLVSHMEYSVQSHRDNIIFLEAYIEEVELPWIVEEAINDKIMKCEQSIKELEAVLAEPWARSVREAK